MRRLTLVLLIFPFVISCQSVDEKYYMKEIRKNCTDPDIVEIERKNDYVEIEYICNGKLYELVIDKKSDAVFTESEADMSRISEIMMKKINKNYPDWTVDEYTQVIINDTTLYKVELIKDGIEQNIYFTLTGKLYKAKNFLASDKWNSSFLKDNRFYNSSAYNFFEPVHTYDLPDILKEVSGISVKGPNQVFCIQDEIGTVFLYNLEKESIEEIYRFADIGDFEDLAFYNGDIHILRSDGALFSIKLAEYPRNINMQYLPIQALNIEGITYDVKNESFLVACHESNINDSLNKRNIYRYSAGKKTDNISKENSVSVDKINEYFKRNFSEIKVSTINFSPSAIAFHPITRDIYILSATDRMILICDSGKNIKAIYPLPSDIFYKPEGIGFYPNGDMLISNEGTNNGLIKPNILFFTYNP